MKIYLRSIGTALPACSYSTLELLDSMKGRLSEEMQSTILSLGISKRHSSLIDFPKIVFRNNLRNRADFHVEETTTLLACKAIQNTCEGMGVEKNQIGCLITVTNTPSYLLPGLATEVVAEMPHLFSTEISVLGIQAMGCSAFLKAVETAGWYLNANPGKLAVISVSEVQTPLAPQALFDRYLSFGEIKALPDSLDNKVRLIRESEQLIQSFLFGDGAFAVVLSSEPNIGTSRGAHSSSPSVYFGPISHLTNADPSDASILTMAQGGSTEPVVDGRPKYSMSPRVPERGCYYAGQTLKRVLAQQDSTIDHIDSAAELFIHTGSRKILEKACEAFGVSSESERVQRSFNVLKDYGNLSSASIGFMMAQGPVQGPTLLSSFGVGFTASSGLLDRA